MTMDPLRICERCEIRHYENCPECFGFGFRGSEVDSSGQPILASAAEAHHKRHSDPVPAPVRQGLFGRGMWVQGWVSIPCPFCGSTADGVPEEPRGILTP